MAEDYIKREDALDIVAQNNVTGEITLNRYDKIIGGIYEIPSADVVEVVRCKDCKWFNRFGCAVEIVDFTDKPTENDYCSFAERKDDE